MTPLEMSLIGFKSLGFQGYILAKFIFTHLENVKTDFDTPALWSWWRYTGPRFNIKISSYQYRKSHCGDKTVIRSSYLHNGISYTGEMSSLYYATALTLSDFGVQIFYFFFLVCLSVDGVVSGASFQFVLKFHFKFHMYILNATAWQAMALGN